MGNCCRNQNYLEPEIEQCNNIQEIKQLLEEKKKDLIKEKEIYNNKYSSLDKDETERSEQLNFNNKNTSFNKSLEEYDRLINLFMKYENKIKNIFKVKKLVNNIYTFAKKTDYASMKYIIDDIENYCISHY